MPKLLELHAPLLGKCSLCGSASHNVWKIYVALCRHPVFVHDCIEPKVLSIMQSSNEQCESYLLVEDCVNQAKEDSLGFSTDLSSLHSYMPAYA